MRPSFALSCVIPLLGAVEPGVAQQAPVQGWAHDWGIIDLQPPAPRLADYGAQREGISEAFARWGVAYDEKRGDILGSLFVPDARFRVVRSDGTVVADVRGRDRIVANLLCAIGRQGDQRRHLITNVLVNPMGDDRARASAYALVVVAGATAKIDGTVVYDASLQWGRDRNWRFVSLTIGLETYGGTPPPQLPER